MFLFYHYRIAKSWDRWEYGLAGHKIINDDNYCKVPLPTIWGLATRSGFLNLAPFTPYWKNTKMEFDMNYLPENLRGKDIKRIGFPRVENFNMTILLQQDGYRKLVRDNLIDMDDENVPSSIKDNAEMILDLSGKRHKLEISVKPNKTRAEEQK